MDRLFVRDAGTGGHECVCVWRSDELRRGSAGNGIGRSVVIRFVHPKVSLHEHLLMNEFASVFEHCVVIDDGLLIQVAGTSLQWAKASTSVWALMLHHWRCDGALWGPARRVE